MCSGHLDGDKSIVAAHHGSDGLRHTVNVEDGIGLTADCDSSIMMPLCVRRDRAATPAAGKAKAKVAAASIRIVQCALEIGLPTRPSAALFQQCMHLGSVQAFGPTFEGQGIGESQCRAVRHFDVTTLAIEPESTADLTGNKRHVSL